MVLALCRTEKLGKNCFTSGNMRKWVQNINGSTSTGLQYIQNILSRDMTPIYLPIKVSIVEQLLCNGCVAAHSSLTFGPNLAISVRSVP